jgi:hypothetical protein
MMMTTRVFESRYKDQRAITIESDLMTALILPDIGAKLCSFCYRPLDLELLVQRPGEQYLLQPYDGSYVASECSGMDDMFPTIDECHYEAYPWKGTRMPDHGEVWSIPWDCTESDGCLHCVTHGVRFPYQLEKWVSFSGDTTLHIQYRLSNLSPFALDYLWAAHPMFVLQEGAELQLPAGVQAVTLVSSLGRGSGCYGDTFDWPIAALATGQSVDLRRIQPKASQAYRKYYVKGRMPEGWCALTYPKSQLALRLDFPVQTVPYLAILPNEGGWQDLYNVFLEPCTAPFDRPDIARLHRALSTVNGRSTHEWHLDMSLSPTG